MDESLEVPHGGVCAVGVLLVPSVILSVGGLDVLNRVNPRGAHPREEVLEAGDDVIAAVTAVVDNDVEAAGLLEHAGQKLRVGLRTLEDLDAPLVVRALVVDVDAVDHSAREVGAPHAKRPATQRGLAIAALRIETPDADLEELHRFIPVGSEMPGIMLGVSMDSVLVRR